MHFEQPAWKRGWDEKGRNRLGKLSAVVVYSDHTTAATCSRTVYVSGKIHRTSTTGSGRRTKPKAGLDLFPRSVVAQEPVMAICETRDDAPRSFEQVRSRRERGTPTRRVFRRPAWHVMGRHPSHARPSRAAARPKAICVSSAGSTSLLFLPTSSSLLPIPRVHATWTVQTRAGPTSQLYFAFFFLCVVKAFFFFYDVLNA